VRKSGRENDWRDLWPHSLIGPKQRRRRLLMSFEMVRLDRASSEPLHQQLYRQIREELDSGSFDSSASRVPSSRALDAALGISSPTVNQAFFKAAFRRLSSSPETVWHNEERR
jgi:hypothetical protein